jgi:hypothetical protein
MLDLIRPCSQYNPRIGGECRLVRERLIKAGSPERRRECLYYLALGNFKLGNYGEARRYNDLLLEKDVGFDQTL